MHRYNGPANASDFAIAVAVDGSGNVVIAASSYNETDADFHTAKYAAADGALLWEKRYNGTGNGNDSPRALAVDDSGNVIVTGYSERSSNWDYYTAKYAAANGALVWEKRYDGPGNSSDGVNAVAVDASGNVIVTGVSDSDYYTAKYAATNGALLWEKRYNGPDGRNDKATAVVVDASGNVVVTGESSANFSADFYTAKYAGADGALLWEKRLSGGHQGVKVLAVDSHDDVMLAGTVDGFTGSGFDYLIVKYAASDGASLWEKRYDGPGNSSDGVNAVAVDASGNVVVTGASIGDGSAFDYYTAKHAAADGALLWEKRYNGPGNSNDVATAVAVNGNGNVVVTGYSTGDGTGPYNHDYYTASYAAADGALLWEERYDGPAHGDDSMLIPSRSLALGRNGTVAITGGSDGIPGDVQIYDCATILYRVIPPPNSFADWAAGFGLSGGAADADADPDADGLRNGAEFVLGGNPTRPALSGRPTATASGGNMSFTFSRDDASETPDVTLTVEAGPDLITWPHIFTIGSSTAASSPGVTISENGTSPDTITVTIPIGTDQTKFARFKLVLAP